MNLMEAFVEAHKQGFTRVNGLPFWTGVTRWLANMCWPDYLACWIGAEEAILERQMHGPVPAHSMVCFDRYFTLHRTVVPQSFNGCNHACRYEVRDNSIYCLRGNTVGMIP